MSNEITTYTPQQVVAQVATIQSLMKESMQDGEHYGVIPGTQKPSLYKAGAEKLGLMFRLRPEYEISTDDYPLELASGATVNHREYTVVCALYMHNGEPAGQGVGLASTMESKHRFRTGEVSDTGVPVPQNYWDARDHKILEQAYQDNYGLKPDSKLGVKKINGMWAIVFAGEKAENENPADNYNTVLKMAKKRAFVDAMITATAASDIFTQDIEDIVQNEKAYEPPKETAKPKDEGLKSSQVVNSNKAYNVKEAAPKMSNGIPFPDSE